MSWGWILGKCFIFRVKRFSLAMKYVDEYWGYQGQSLYRLPVRTIPLSPAQSMEVNMDLSYHSRHAASAARLRKRIQREGYTMSGKKVWSQEEDELFRSLFPDYAAITKALPHRTYFACRGHARKLGIVTARPPFTAKELSLIRRLYPAAEREELLLLLPGRKWEQIKSLANRHGVHRLPKSFAPTGVPVLDQIRLRCRELNYSMPDLDKLIRGKGYFAKGNWCHGHIHHRDIGRAVRALFGDLKADWK